MIRVLNIKMKKATFQKEASSSLISDKREAEVRHTEQIQDIIGTPPSWMVRWGMTLLFGIVVMLIGLFELIKYPDTIKTQLKIRSSTLDQAVIVKDPGKILTLLVKNNEEVQNREALAVIENANGKDSLIAPQAGKLTYARILYQNQEVLANQIIFNITKTEQNFFGEMLVPLKSIGKVKENQEVIIKLAEYPYEEYGILHGRIKYIINNPANNGQYLAEVDLMTKDKTDIGKSISLKHGMAADAEIIVQNVSLFHRISKNLLK